ncbi:MAG: hypothetical protein ACUVWX_03515 [Kiritimatiellia bacterium]
MGKTHRRCRLRSCDGRGRVFYCRRMRTEDGYSERFVLEDRDAFNGLLLWQKPVKGPLGEKYGDWNIVATA